MDKTNKNIACGAGWGTGDGYGWGDAGGWGFMGELYDFYVAGHGMGRASGSKWGDGDGYGSGTASDSRLGTGSGWDWDNGGKIYFLHGHVRR